MKRSFPSNWAQNMRFELARKVPYAIVVLSMSKVWVDADFNARKCTVEELRDGAESN